MAIPLPTTTIDIYRGSTIDDPEADGYDGDYPAKSMIDGPVPACISGPSSTVVDGMEVDRWQLRADPCDLRLNDEVLDATTAITYKVTKCVHSRVTMFGLAHVHAELAATQGLPTEGGNDVDS